MTFLSFHRNTKRFWAAQIQRCCVWSQQGCSPSRTPRMAWEQGSSRFGAHVGPCCLLSHPWMGLGCWGAARGSSRAKQKLFSLFLWCVINQDTQCSQRQSWRHFCGSPVPLPPAHLHRGHLSASIHPLSPRVCFQLTPEHLRHSWRAQCGH